MIPNINQPYPATFVEDAEILARQDFAAQQHIFKFAAPQCARVIQPGQVICLAGDPAEATHRLPVLRANANQGTLEVLFAATHPGLSALADKQIGDRINLSGPIGHGFEPHIDKPCAVLLGSGDGMAAMIFLVEHLRDRRDANWKPLVFLGSELPFPFRIRPSTILVNGMPDGVIASPTFLDEQGIASRLSSHAELPGCHEGSITDLASAWLATLNSDALREVELFVCGPKPLLIDATQVARDFGVACQVTTEE